MGIVCCRDGVERDSGQWVLAVAEMEWNKIEGQWVLAVAEMEWSEIEGQLVHVTSKTNREHL